MKGSGALYAECRDALTVIKEAEDGLCAYEKTVSMFPACKQIWEKIETHMQGDLHTDKTKDRIYEELAKKSSVSLRVSTYKLYVKYHQSEKQIRAHWRKNNFTPTKVTHWQYAYTDLHSTPIPTFGAPPPEALSPRKRRVSRGATDLETSSRLADVEKQNYKLAQRVATIEEDLKGCMEKLESVTVTESRA